MSIHASFQHALSIQVTLSPTLLGKLKIEHKNTFHTLFWLLSATSKRGCISGNNCIRLLLRAQQNNAGRDINPTVFCPLKQKHTCFLLIHCVLKTPFSHFLSPLAFHAVLFPSRSSAQSPSSHNPIHPGVISVMRRSPFNILVSEITDYEKRPTLF